MSHSSGGGVMNKRTIIYPAGWSMERYEQSLTDEVKEIIQLDKVWIGSIIQDSESKEQYLC